ncbi:hypothetical protein [uncultured Aquimarina sp.]|uniref:hypothetical protein n=1 Tax=uncultured Aquimarina sp. TaxID=575652 RepID=UPI0026166320|nr:hypothetical protein [uncultured Aquimarina sp.]
MLIDKILSFLFGVKKSKLKINQKEQEHVNSGYVNISKREIVDVDKTSLDQALWDKKNNHSELLLEIFNEAKSKSDYEHHNLWAITFNTLDSYSFLFEQHPSFKKSFLFYLIKYIIEENESKYSEKKPPVRFVIELFNLVLKSKLTLNEEDFIKILELVRTPLKYQFSISFTTIFNKLKKFCHNKQISNVLVTYLKTFMKSDGFREVGNYSENDFTSIVERIVLNNSLKSQGEYPVFVLLSDYFGTKVNKHIQSLEVPINSYLSQILNIYNTHSQLNHPNEISSAIENQISQNGILIYRKKIHKMIEIAANFKPKTIRIIGEKIEWNPGYRSYCVYTHMRKENIKIVKGIVLSAAYYNDKKSIQHILKIVERCYTTSDIRRLGSSSRSLGKTCIYVLAHCFEEKGQKELKMLYNQTKLKSIKKQIEKESKVLEQTTGTPLL